MAQEALDLLEEDDFLLQVPLSEHVLPISHIGLYNSTFNIEYFWDPERRDLNLLEINPRHSQSHDKLLQLVDGLPNHKVHDRSGTR